MEKLSSRVALPSAIVLLVMVFQNVKLCFGLKRGRQNASAKGSEALSFNPSALLKIKEMVEVDPYLSLASWGADLYDADPCSWHGILCEDGRVLSLNLEDLCLKGVLSPEMGKLVHLKYLILHNNSFYGAIPREIGELQKMKWLDLGHNNFAGSFPSDIRNLLALEVLVLTPSQILDGMPPEFAGLDIHSKLHASNDLLALYQNSITRSVGNATIRKLLEGVPRDPERPASQPYLSPLTPSPHVPVTPNVGISRPKPRKGVNPPAANNSTPQEPLPPAAVPDHPLLGSSIPARDAKKKNPLLYIVVGLAYGLFVITVACILYFRCKKGAVVKPWETDMLFLERSELQTACEDFSNVIGSSIDSVMYKGMLSSGVEIAVWSVVAKSSKNWSKHLESQFRKKIDMLSRVNHRNFVNLLGYCADDKPFTRMMVFEYAPNGTLHDHLHIKGAQDLDWAARVRIAMGIAYCLEYISKLDSPMNINSLDSNSILLTDDCAAKISVIGLNHEATGANMVDDKLNEEIVIYKYGMLLLEIVSGRLPYPEENGNIVTWASDYLTGKKPLKDMIDPMLNTLQEEDVTGICGVISSCLSSDPKERPSLGDLVARLREITSINTEGAAPSLSTLWWAELELFSQG